jgi:hypothetical protein
MIHCIKRSGVQMDGEKAAVNYFLAAMSINMKFHIDVGSDHFDTESFYWFRKLSAPAPN